MRALVTGGNRGIGLEIAKGLLARDIHVIIGVRDFEAGKQVANEIGADCVYCDLDGAFDTMVLPSDLEVDILVNNAGVLYEADLFSKAAKFDETIDVMLRAPYLMMRSALSHMKRGGYGRIVNVSSGWGSFAEGLGGPGAYGIAKAALNALTVASAREAPPGVKINAMCPGWVHTRMGGPSAPLTPEEGADTAIWLATLPEDGPNGKFFRRRKEIEW
ncbi:MAG: SDR family NAD(P)-dependent oxidoreductase [Pseudomonadota bacterium]